jgi:hypothetical protein
MNKNFPSDQESLGALLSLATSSSYAQNMIRTVNISDAKANLSKLANDVAQGDEVLPQTVLNLSARNSTASSGAITAWKWSVVQPQGSASVLGGSFVWGAVQAGRPAVGI